jgi:hypothetical protein
MKSFTPTSFGLDYGRDVVSRAGPLDSTGVADNKAKWPRAQGS